MIESFNVLDNIGQFGLVRAGARIPLAKLSLVYAENGRGKTTLAAILRSLATGDSTLIAERKRLGSPNPPNVVIQENSAPAVFQNGVWSRILPQIAVYDDKFVAENVCSGMQVATEQRQNLHELILGAQGVALNHRLQAHIDAVEEHIRQLRIKGDAIPTAMRGSLSVEQFCALEPRNDIDAALQIAERNISAAHAADTIRTRAPFRLLNLPVFDAPSVEALLNRGLPDLDAAAAGGVQAHLSTLGGGAEEWLAGGISRIAEASAGVGHEVCPFCTQNIDGSALIAHYRAYFGEAYDELKKAISAQIASVNSIHAGDIPSAFERSVLQLTQDREFWSKFTDVPEIRLDTAAIARAWKAARDGVSASLNEKLSAPLEHLTLAPAVLAAIEQFHRVREDVNSLSAQLAAANTRIALVKEQAAAANVSALEADLARLKLIKARHTPEVDALCRAYLVGKASKATTEGLRDQARGALDQYRNSVFPAYEGAINDYLRQFNAGFRLAGVNSINTRTGSSCTYSVVINNVSIPITAATPAEPSFRNTLSAGDRNTLALAFFFASLEQDPDLGLKIVVIDDPITSLDEHRTVSTVQEFRRLFPRVDQIIVLSHSKSFLCALWEGADTATRTAIRINRDATGSSIAGWDVNRDCITEHDRRHTQVSSYVQASDPTEERAVAEALRPILEAFLRVAYPADFPAGTLLGSFINVCRQRVGTPREILNNADIAELDDLREYGNRFHHDSNPAWQTVLINDQELVRFCQRTLAFASRR